MRKSKFKYIIVTLFLFSVFIEPGCLKFDRNNPDDYRNRAESTGETDTAAAGAPVFSLPGGTYSSAQTLTIICATEGAKIIYTTDSTDPSRSGGTEYTGPVEIRNTQTIKAIAYVPDWPSESDSGIVSASYEITGTVANPQFSLSPGAYEGAQTLTITCPTSGVVIKYAVSADGSVIPSRTTGDVYTGPVTLGLGKKTVKAFAYIESWETGTDSGVISSGYRVRDVYIAGTELNGEGKGVAKYWKNNSSGVTLLSDGTKSTQATSIYISEGNIYIAGTEIIDSVNDLRVVKYWKNDFSNVVNLTDGTKTAKASSICVSGSNVYVAGSVTDSRIVAKYWKNNKDTVTVLSNVNNNANARSVFVSGSDIYIAGFEYYSTGVSVYAAKYWKNNTSNAVILTDGNRTAYANDIFVSGSDVYVSGLELNAAGKRVAKYWKNDMNTVTVLSDGTNEAYAAAIFVSGSDVYAAGYETNGTKKVAKYWKNNISNTVILTDGTNDAEANDIYVSGSDVYIAGYESNGTNSVAKYWVNGRAVQLSAGNTPATSGGMFVVEQ